MISPRRILDHIPAVVFFVALTAVLLIGNGVRAQETAPPDTSAAALQTDTIPPADAYPQPPSNVQVKDNPDDAGGSIDVAWTKSPSDVEGGKVTGYVVLRSTSQTGPFKQVGEVASGDTSLIDGNTSDDSTYYYAVEAVNSHLVNNEVQWVARAQSNVAGPVESSAQWFNMQRINVFVGVFILCALIIFYISQAKAGKKLFIRKIAGLEAVDEAVGRATEMGKKIFYVPGTQDMDNVQTIAGVTILGRVAELAARYETWLEVPVSRSLVLVTSKEMVKEAYAKAGRPDAYHEDQVHYLTDDQFGYAAAIDGMMVREEPATVFYMGAFYAESLILAETGNSIGAIQIAGTGMPAQLPFFVAACDYTLIGEELFAASAYLSREPKLLGSLKGQDIGKAVILVAIIVGIILETFHIWSFSSLFTVIG